MSQEELRQKVPVLLIEDDPEDIAITRRAFREGRVKNPLFVARDGKEAMEFLRREGRYADAEKAPRPALILLDLNMPGLDGRGVLKQIKDDPKLRRIPVVILTTSCEDADALDCYDDGANTYITKPVEFDRFLSAVNTIKQYWLDIAVIPSDCQGA